MAEHLLPIGEISRRSGLTVSAMRFYDREGVLPAASVDPVTGYRRYHPSQVRTARLLAGMRRIQVPLAEMVAVLEAGSDVETVEDLLDAHVARLEDGLQRARSEAGRILALALDGGVQLRTDAGRLASALSGVRYAVSHDPELPALSAVLLEADAGGLRAVATDRYRLALATVPAAGGGDDVSSQVSGQQRHPVGVLLEPAALEEVLAHLAEHPGQVRVGLSRSGLELRGDRGGPELAVAGMDATFPDYRVVVDRAVAGTGAQVMLGELRDELPWPEEAPDTEPDPGSTVSLRGGHLVASAYLADAVRAVGPSGQLRLPTEIGPLVLADDDGARLALVMPIAAGGRA